MAHTISLINVSKTYTQGTRPLSVLSQVSATFQQGQSYAITGVSGSGKSTLLHLIGGLDKPTQGTVLFDDHDLAALPAADKRRFLNERIGLVFQFHYLLKELSVLENVMLMGFIKGQTTPVARQRALELLEQVGLADKANEYPTKLSGGQQQRASIARALFNRPAFLLADEPTGSLDAGNAHDIIDLFMQAKAEWGMGMIICSHDQHVYKRMDHVLPLDNGRLSV